MVGTVARVVRVLTSVVVMLRAIAVGAGRVIGVGIRAESGGYVRAFRVPAERHCHRGDSLQGKPEN